MSKTGYAIGDRQALNVTVEPNRHTQVLVYAAAWLTIGLWTLTPIATRAAANEVDGFLVGMIRTVGAGLVAAGASPHFPPPATQRLDGVASDAAFRLW